jgi:hypothetical protein
MVTIKEKQIWHRSINRQGMFIVIKILFISSSKWICKQENVILCRIIETKSCRMIQIIFVFTIEIHSLEYHLFYYDAYIKLLRVRLLTIYPALNFVFSMKFMRLITVLFSIFIFHSLRKKIPMWSGRYMLSNSYRNTTHTPWRDFVININLSLIDIISSCCVNECRHSFTVIVRILWWLILFCVALNFEIDQTCQKKMLWWYFIALWYNLWKKKK